MIVVLFAIICAGVTCTVGADPVRLASPVTHSDWMVRGPSPEWGHAGEGCATRA